MNIILLGGPGTGKSTQSEILKERFGMKTVSTGNLIREAIRKKTPVGLMAKNCIEHGQFVPDEVVINIIKERVLQSDCKNGFVLDGFPRNIAQAKALEDMGIHIDGIFHIVVDPEVLIERLGGRLTCPECGASYHTVDKPSSLGDHCEKCGTKLQVRADDDAQTVVKRMEIYEKETYPLVEYYSKNPNFVELDGTKTIEQVSEDIKNSLEAF